MEPVICGECGATLRWTSQPVVPAEGPVGQTLLRMGNRIADLAKERDALLAQVAAQPAEGPWPVGGWSDEPCNRQCGHRGPHTLAAPVEGLNVERPCRPATTHRYRRVGQSNVLCCVRCGQGKRDIVGVTLAPTPPDALRAAAQAVALDYHSFAIACNEVIDIDGSLHPAVTWRHCTAPKCAALRAALEADHD